MAKSSKTMKNSPKFMQLNLQVHQKISSLTIVITHIRN